MHLLLIHFKTFSLDDFDFSKYKENQRQSRKQNDALFSSGRFPHICLHRKNSHLNETGEYKNLIFKILDVSLLKAVLESICV